MTFRWCARLQSACVYPRLWVCHVRETTRRSERDACEGRLCDLQLEHDGVLDCERLGLAMLSVRKMSRRPKRVGAEGRIFVTFPAGD